jgi:hypothetical protein
VQEGPPGNQTKLSYQFLVSPQAGSLYSVFHPWIGSLDWQFRELLETSLAVGFAGSPAGYRSSENTFQPNLAGGND